MTSKLPAQDEFKHQLLKHKMLTVAKFAEALGVAPNTVHKWMAKRQIHYLKIGPPSVDAMGRDRRTVRIPESELQRLMEHVDRIY